MWPGPVPDDLREGPEPPQWERATVEHQKLLVGRTETGVFLIFLGWLLAWTPSGGHLGLILVGLFASLMQFVGVALVFLGRNAFGREHRSNVVVSVVLIIALNIAEPALFATSETRIPRLSESEHLTWHVVIGALWGLSFVLLAYHLAARRGLALLWGAFSADIVASIVYWFPRPRPLPLQPSLSWFDFIWLVPSFLFALGYYAAWARIRRGGIPETFGGPVDYASPPGSWLCGQCGMRNDRFATQCVNCRADSW